MSEDQRSSGGGSLFVLLIMVGFVVMFWWVFAIIIGIALLIAASWYVSRRLDARDAARAAIAARADEQHALVLAGDDRGVYGEYRPEVYPTG
jgi:hypothetical protein